MHIPLPHGQLTFLRFPHKKAALGIRIGNYFLPIQLFIFSKVLKKKLTRASNTSRTSIGTYITHHLTLHLSRLYIECVE